MTNLKKTNLLKKISFIYSTFWWRFLHSVFVGICFCFLHLFRGSHQIYSQCGLQLLFQFPKYWDYRHAPPHLICLFFFLIFLHLGYLFGGIPCQRTACGVLFSPTMWVPDVQVKSSTLVAPTESSCWPLIIVVVIVKIQFYLCVCVYTCVFVCVHMNEVPAKVRGGCRIPWSWRSMQLCGPHISVGSWTQVQFNRCDRRKCS